MKLAEKANHLHWAGILVIIAFALTGLAGWWYATIAHIPFWHGAYCALGEAVTAGGDCNVAETPHELGYLVTTIEFLTILPLFTTVATLVATHLINRIVEHHVTKAKNEIKEHTEARIKHHLGIG